jgi:hypothetical protein
VHVGEKDGDEAMFTGQVGRGGIEGDAVEEASGQIGSQGIEEGDGTATGRMCSLLLNEPMRESRTLAPL